MWDPKKTLKSVGLGPKSEQKRSVRVAEAIRNEISTLLIMKAQDPELDGASVTRVEVADDLQYARIFFTALNPQRLKHVEKGLQRAKGFMRSHLAHVLNLRYTPELHFVRDSEIEKVAEVERLLQEIASERGDDDESSS